jgi:pimeloyl-ACP methyl ester carboxylesterase
MAPEPFEIRITGEQAAELRERLGRTRWASQPAGGWVLGADIGYLRELCQHWAGSYDFGRLERLNELGSIRVGEIHLLHLRSPRAEPAGHPVVLLHGWPSGPIEYEAAARRLAASGREVIVPSLPGYAWSDDPGEPLDVAAVAARLHEAVSALLGETAGAGERRTGANYAVASGDWGAAIAARLAFDQPGAVAALHVTTPHTLPVPGDLGHPPLSEAEVAWMERARRWQRKRGYHLAVQSQAPDAISPALADSPAGLAAYLVPKYRGWSDSGGEVERRFSKDELCDFLTMFWVTGTIASSMRLYLGEARNRWRLAPEERIEAAAGCAVFPGEMAGEWGDAEEGAPAPGLNPPREWTERILHDLRRWTEMPAGGHFAAFEEPEAYASELLAFLDQIGA